MFDEASVNLMGYEHMQAGDVKGAIEILKLNAYAYPNSPNVYDSLGDAYLADGQGELARQNSNKALVLLSVRYHGQSAAQRWDQSQCGG